jgi:hypothetical protein
MLGTEFQINTYTTASQEWPSVAVSPDGDFVVTWHSTGSPGTDTRGESIQGQRYASDGSTQGAQFQVNTYTTGYQVNPSVAMAANGDFVVAWRGVGLLYIDPSGWDIRGQRYASDGSKQGAEFQMNTYTTGHQILPWVATDAEGDFVVTWTSRGSPGTDTSGNSVQGQRFDSNGSIQGAQFQVNTYTTNDQVLFRSLAVDSDGDFVVTWLSYGSSGTDTSLSSVQGQRYASNGSAQGTQFQVNTYTTFYQTLPAVAMLADTGFIVAWQSMVSSGTDSDGDSIQGQRYRTAIPVPALSPSMILVLAAALLLGAGLGLRGRARC